MAGKWLLSMETPNGTMNPGLDLKVDGKKVTGTLTSPQGEVAVAGEFADNKLALTASFQGNGGEMTITFAGTLKADGTMAGTMAFPQGEIPWTAARPKRTMTEQDETKEDTPCVKCLMLRFWSHSR